MVKDGARWAEPPEPMIENLREGQVEWTACSYFRVNDDDDIVVYARARVGSPYNSIMTRETACRVWRENGTLYVQPSHDGIRFRRSPYTYHYEVVATVVDPPTGFVGFFNRYPFWVLVTMSIGSLFFGLACIGLLAG